MPYYDTSNKGDEPHYDVSKKGDKWHNKSSSDSTTVEQIQELIANAINAQLGKGLHINHRRTKTYTKGIDALRMQHGHQSHKFHEFDGRGNP